ncbi:MAG TPA: hypothetical protein DEQ20_03095, partial [Desulfobulbaceae bacterium]|nr:hypothetical protein [Desulfobulbaceae bacterium]
MTSIIRSRLKIICPFFTLFVTAPYAARDIPKEQVIFARRLTRLQCIFAGLLISCFLLSGVAFAKKPAVSSPKQALYAISGINLDQTADGVQLVIQGSAPPTYTIYELFDPLRIVLDIADGRLVNPAKMPANLPHGAVQDIKNITLPDQKPAIVRLEIYLSGDPTYTIARKGNNIVVNFTKVDFSQLNKTTTIASPEVNLASVLKDLELDSTANPAELITPKFPNIKPKAKPLPEKAPTAKVSAPSATSAPEKKSPEKAPSDSLAFAGYEKQKITVDFFKIDLHNVFRLFGEISGQNIVVDEGVSGTLTLSLNDIPWDFALDIILNLKDLQKEERFNTLVIAPKAKQFNWPKTATSAISVKGGETVETISVKQRLETPKEVIEAKNLIQQAIAAEKNDQPEKALSLYETAFSKWPKNVQLASRIASLCLTQLGMNAKAIHYAKATLALEPANAGAALMAAIGSANMKKIETAKAYFDLAISGDAPASEALVSYASFAEEY